LSIIKTRPFCRTGNATCISSICLLFENNSKHHIELSIIAQASKKSVQKYFRDLGIRKIRNDRSKTIRNRNPFIKVVEKEDLLFCDRKNRK
jgi:hypothetical protein